MMKIKHVLSLLLLVGALTFSAGAYENDLQLVDLSVPGTIGSGAPGSLMLPPQTSMVNPASAALAQRITFDAGYIAIFGDDTTASGWKGHGIHFGHTIPTKAGVFTWNTGFLTSSFDSLDTGSQFALSGSFAKDIYPDTFVGIGMKTVVAEGPQYTAAADIGLIRTKPDLLFLRDVKWSLSLQNIGYSNLDALRSPLYILSAAVDGELMKKEKISSRLVAQIDWAEFTNVRASIGLNVLLGKYFNIGVGSRLDMRDIFDGDAGGMIPSLSLSYTYIPGEENVDTLTRNELQPYVFAAPVTSELWTAGAGITVPVGRIDKEAPDIKIDLSDVIRKFEPEKEDTVDEDPEDGADKLSTLDNRYSSGKGPYYAPFRTVADEVEENKETPAVKKVKTAAEDFSAEELRNEIQEADIYLSPNNDGVQDDLSFPLNISEGRYIKGYEFIVENADGELVRKILNKEKRPEKRTARTFFQNLFSVKSGIQVPETIRWDGTTDTGEQAQDGLYTFYIRAWDDNRNYGTSEKYTVYIDTQPPVVTVQTAGEQDRIFSPNDDGNKDVLPVVQTGTGEDLWQAFFYDSIGNAVKSMTWNDGQPQEFAWDGTNDEGLLVPDGVYRYEITSTDRAGNRGVGAYANLVKNTEETPVSITIDNSHFSPNGDGILDVLLFEPGIPVTAGIKNWTLSVKDMNDGIRREYRGAGSPAGTTAFDGRDSQNRALPEGQYYAELDVLYINGNNPKAESAAFILDVSPPQASINLDTLIFSPNGDGNMDLVHINQETSLEENWFGTITDIDESVVYQFKWIERADSTIAWDGRESDGSLAEDGYYFYQLSTVDRAGNPGQSSRVRFELNTEETEVLLTTNYDHFSPNGDGIKDTLGLLPRLKGSRRVKDYELSITTASGDAVYSRTGAGDVPESIAWDGFTIDGAKASDGEYRALLDVTNLNGNRNSARTQLFTIDTVSPQAELDPEYLIFSPEGDGRRDTLSIAVKNPSSEELWEGQVMDEDGTVVKSAAWQGKAEDFTWDGTDAAGNTAEDGIYTYRLYSTDKAGNYTEIETDRIVLDTSPTKLFVTSDSDKLAPNGDGIYEEISFSTIVTRSAGLDAWSLELVDAGGRVQKSFEGTEQIPRKIVWDGKNERGEFVESEYTARFSAEYRKGNRPVVESLPFILDITPPRLGVDIKPAPFSPDNDGVDDELSIRLSVSDTNDIERWEFIIYDAERSGVSNDDAPRFHVYSGSGKPTGELIWDGRSDGGELVYAAMDYPYSFLVRDVFGNIAVERGKIPIDVLVIREGNLLKIKIANINFKPNEAVYVDDDPQISARNEYVLDRLAEILKKYRQYRITIQGHANVTKFWDNALAAQEQQEELLPLSEKRAYTVMDSLIERNISKDRLSAEGVGGSQPLVPFDDAENRWKNRRVEFILEKE